MAGAKETAIGIASVLGSDHSPNPLPLSFKGQMLTEAAEIVELTVSECRDAGINLLRLELDPELFEELEGKLDVPLRLSLDLLGSVRFVKSN